MDPLQAMHDREAAFRTLLVGPGVEALGRRFLETTRLPSGPVTAVGPSVIGGQQVDLVAIDRSASGRRTVRAIGEVKSGERVGRAHLERLEAIRSSLHDASDAVLVLASLDGFSIDLARLARSRSDVELVDAERLLEWSAPS